MFSHLFRFFHKKQQSPKHIQMEYVPLIQKIMASPLWDGSDGQIIHALPKDLNPDTIAYVRELTDRK